MATCKDCVHCDVCYVINAKIAPADTPCDECTKFKAKSRFVELPCKIFDEVYVILKNKVCKGKVRKILFNHKNELVMCVARYESEYFSCGNYKLSSFGKTVFLTKEEAEKA